MTCMRLRLSDRKGLHPIGHLDCEWSRVLHVIMTQLLSFSSDICLSFQAKKCGLLQRLSILVKSPSPYLHTHTYTVLILVSLQEPDPHVKTGSHNEWYVPGRSHHH